MDQAHDRNSAVRSLLDSAHTTNEKVGPGQSSRSAGLRKPVHANISDLGRPKDAAGDLFDENANALLRDHEETGEAGQLVLRRACAACAAEEKNKKIIRRSSIGSDPKSTSPDLLDYLNTSAGSGQPLDPATRASFEKSLGVDLGNVRVVTDAAAAAAVEALGARAFTYGSTIWFGRGEYRPSSEDGQRLLAHEVAHTVQQSAGAPTLQREVIVGGSDDPAERAADLAADAMMRGEAAAVGGASGATLRRQCQVRRPEPSETFVVDNVRYVDCGDAVWRVTREPTDSEHAIDSEPSRVPVTHWAHRFRMINFTVEGGCSVCRGPWMVGADLSLHLDEVIFPAIQNILNRAPVTENMQIQPEVNVYVAVSHRGELDLRVMPTWDVGERELQQIQGSLGMTTPRGFGIEINGQYNTVDGAFDFELTLRFTAAPREVDCSRPVRSNQESIHQGFELACRREPSEGDSDVPGNILENMIDPVIYAMFPHESRQISGWRFEGDHNIDQRDDVQFDDVKFVGYIRNAIRQGFRIRSVIGYASPEGPRQLHRPHRRYQGNDPLSSDRATVAYKEFLETWQLAQAAEGQVTDPSSGVDLHEEQPPQDDSVAHGEDRLRRADESTNEEVEVRGGGELYSPLPRHGREVEGRALESYAIEQYLDEDALRPDDPAAFQRQSHTRQTAQTYQSLRRVEIRLERIPRRVNLHSPDPEGCPDSVIELARDDFEQSR